MRTTRAAPADEHPGLGHRRAIDRLYRPLERGGERGGIGRCRSRPRQPDRELARHQRTATQVQRDEPGRGGAERGPDRHLARGGHAAEDELAVRTRHRAHAPPIGGHAGGPVHPDLGPHRVHRRAGEPGVGRGIAHHTDHVPGALRTSPGTGAAVAGVGRRRGEHHALEPFSGHVDPPARRRDARRIEDRVRERDLIGARGKRIEAELPVEVGARLAGRSLDPEDGVRERPIGKQAVANHAGESAPRRGLRCRGRHGAAGEPASRSGPASGDATGRPRARPAAHTARIMSNLRWETS